MALVQLLKKLKKKGHYLYKSWQKKEIEYRLYLSVQNIKILDYQALQDMSPLRLSLIHI